jgi:CheY-like chemotaxis protein
MKILVVDDDPDQLETLADLVDELELDIITAINGRIALDLAKEHKPDCIVSDIQMPEMAG